MVNVATMLAVAAARYPQRAALRFGDDRVSYEGLAEQAARFGSALLDRGLAPGDRVALFAKNSAEYVAALYGSFAAGLTIVPINAKLSGPELAVILADCDASALVHDPGGSATVERAIEAHPVEHRVETGSSFAALLAAGDAAFAPSAVADDALAWLFYTSGTTGKPKGAELTHRNLCAMTWLELCDVCDFRADDLVLHVAPLSHGSGLYLLGSIARGAENLIYDGASFDPGDVLETIEREQVTVIGFLAPTMIVMLLEAGVDADVSSLRRAVYGGAPIDRNHAERMVARFGDAFVQIYGQGETPMTITYLDPRVERTGDELLTSAGVPHPGIEVRLVDAEDRLVPQGEEGEVCVRGDTVMRGYWRNPGASAEALRGGWLHTGDIGRFDGSGHLYLLDRSKDVIISGGANIYPREVEEVLLRHEAIDEAVVFGEADDLWGESVVAAVVAGGDGRPTESAVIQFCRERIASFKKPKRIVFVDELPRNAYGKVLRRDLRQRFALGEVETAR